MMKHDGSGKRSSQAPGYLAKKLCQDQGITEEGDPVNSNPKCEYKQEEEINLYYYWKVLVKRKTVFIVIFLFPLVIATAFSLLQPRYYRGESEIIYPVIPPQTIVNLLGDFDDAKKDEVFITTPGAIRSVLLSTPKKPNDKVNIILESKTSDVIPQAFQDFDHYLCNLREFKEGIARINKKNEMQLEWLLEAKKANLIYLDQITEMIKKRKMPLAVINPADLIKKDADLSLEIMNLQQEREIMGTRGSLGPISITVLPSNSTIKQILIFTGIVGLFTGLFVVFFLEYIDRMKANEKA
jgi:hypothetical protein